jgi:voltage-gated potassium channel
MDEANLLMNALNASRRRISVFVFGVLLLVSFLGALMYVVEGPENGFKNIPLSIYWAVVTLTTVGYGDISPQTPLGQALSVVIMLMGYGIIAIPTGIVTSELVNSNGRVEGKVCSRCLLEGHDIDAVYCKQCGNKL